MKFVNLTPHDINIVRPGGVAAACGAYHWEFFPEGTELPEDVVSCPCECMVGVPSLELTIPASGKIARCKAEEEMVDSITVSEVWNGRVPIFRTSFGAVEVTDTATKAVEVFPEPEEDVVVYITSALVAERLQRADVVSPHTIRDAAGKITGCDGFVRFDTPPASTKDMSEFETDELLMLASFAWGHYDWCNCRNCQASDELARRGIASAS